MNTFKLIRDSIIIITCSIIIAYMLYSCTYTYKFKEVNIPAKQELRLGPSQHSLIKINSQKINPCAEGAVHWPTIVSHTKKTNKFKWFAFDDVDTAYLTIVYNLSLESHIKAVSPDFIGFFLHYDPLTNKVDRSEANLIIVVNNCIISAKILSKKEFNELLIYELL